MKRRGERGWGWAILWTVLGVCLALGFVQLLLVGENAWPK
jgi:hypothetical protein